MALACSSSQRTIPPHAPRTVFCVAVLGNGLVNGGIGLAAGVGLDVHMRRSEELPGPVDGEAFDLVHDLAAAVVALAGIALGVLVREQRPERLQDGRAGEVLRGNE